RGIHAVLRMHQRRIVSFRPHKRRQKGQTGKRRSRFMRRLGKHDQIVAWIKPGRKNKPKWMSVKQYEQLPAEIQLRELRYLLPRRGQRTLCVTIATTLLDPTLYPKEKIAELYGVRWQAET